MTTPSDISIKLAGVEISQRVLYAETSFESQANPIAGTWRVTVKDPDQDFSATTGQRLTLHVDGVPLGGGYVTRIGRQHFFSAVDTASPSTVRTRKWVLTGPDFNILFDKRVVHDPNDPVTALKVPSGRRTISRAFTYFMNNFIDVPPGLDYHTHVDTIDTAYGSDQHGGLYVEQGRTWRDQMEDFADNGGVVYYIDADFAVHLHEYETQRVPWLFVDAYPNGTKTIGFREGSYEKDFTRIVTEALVWGGSALARPGQDLESADAIGVVFAKYPDPPAADATWAGRLQPAEREQAALDRLDDYGRWQYAEVKVGEENYLTKGSIKNRAFVIINGPPGRVPTLGIEGGFSKPLDVMRATWFAHDVPSGQHLRPGYLHDFILYTQGEDPSHPLVTSLPLRSMQISFPTLPSDNPAQEPKAFVRFDGEFGTSFEDSRHLWKAIQRSQRRARRRAERIVSVVDASSTDSVAIGSYAEAGPNEEPNGVLTTFSFPFTFWPGTIKLYLNGLFQISGENYFWDTATNSATFLTALDATDKLWITGNVSE